MGDRAAFEIVDWDNDGRYDLIVGALDGKVRVYLNEAVSGQADFLVESIITSDSSDLAVAGGRSSVAVADLNWDGRKDLLIGNTDGKLLFYSNIGTDSQPIFNGFQLLEAGGTEIDLPSTARSRPFVGDYNLDGVPDILVGSRPMD